MTALGNKEVMAENLKFYMARFGKTQKELAEYLGVTPAAFNEWVKARKYPRIDKIEKLANYFGILKSDLIEKRSPEREEMQKKNDILADIVIRLRTDDDFLYLVETLYKCDNDKLNGVSQMLNAFLK